MSVPILFLVAGVGVYLFGLSAILRWLWNMTMLELFGLSGITYWQAFRLNVMSLILFGGLVR